MPFIITVQQIQNTLRLNLKISLFLVNLDLNLRQSVLLEKWFFLIRLINNNYQL